VWHGGQWRNVAKSISASAINGENDQYQSIAGACGISPAWLIGVSVMSGHQLWRRISQLYVGVMALYSALAGVIYVS